MKNHNNTTYPSTREVYAMARKYNEENPWDPRLVDKFFNALNNRNAPRLHNNITDGCFENNRDLVHLYDDHIIN